MNPETPAGIEPGNPVPAVVFDIDGTLCDTSEVNHYITVSKDFNAFHEASANCPPIYSVEIAARRAYMDGAAVILSTGRPERWRELTDKWLAKNFIRYTLMCMRPDDDFTPAADLKRTVLDGLRDMGYEILAAWEDHPGCAAMYRDEGVPSVHLVPGYAGI